MSPAPIQPPILLLVRRFGHLVIFGGVLIVGGQSQNSPAQAQQQDAGRRIERLEDFRTDSVSKTSKLEQIAEQQQALMNQVVASNAKQDDRLQAQEEGLKVITASAESVRATTEDFKGSIQTWISVGGVLFIGLQLFIAWRQDKRMMNGHSPFTKLQKQMAEDREETDKILKALLQAMESQPKRRTSR